MSPIIRGDGRPAAFTPIFCFNNEMIEIQIYGIFKRPPW